MTKAIDLLYEFAPLKSLNFGAVLENSKCFTVYQKTPTLTDFPCKRGLFFPQCFLHIHEKIHFTYPM